MPNQQLQERIQELEPLYREYILSDDIAEIAKEFSEVHGFDETNANLLENGIFLFMLFFINKKTLVDFIVKNCRLEQHEAAVLVEAIIMSVPDNIRAMQTKTSLVIFSETDPKDTTEKEILETETSIEYLNSIRTMPADKQQNNETTHTSTQSAILNDRPPFSNTSQPKQ